MLKTIQSNMLLKFQQLHVGKSVQNSPSIQIKTMFYLSVKLVAKLMYTLQHQLQQNPEHKVLIQLKLKL